MYTSYVEVMQTHKIPRLSWERPLTQAENHWQRSPGAQNRPPCLPWCNPLCPSRILPLDVLIKLEAWSGNGFLPSNLSDAPSRGSSFRVANMDKVSFDPQRPPWENVLVFKMRLGWNCVLPELYPSGSRPGG